MEDLGKVMIVAVACIAIATGARAQEKVEVELSGDLVSSYVWRGVKQTGASVQPSLGVDYKGFSLGAWASTDLSNDGFKEVDFSLGYQYKWLSLALTDYWWDGERAGNYFGQHGYGDGHMLEASLGVTFSERFPLSLTWNTFLLGRGNKKENGRNSYTTFVEMACPFVVAGVDFEAALGVSPWKSPIYGNDKFSLTQIKLEAAKEIRITDSFSLPIFGGLIFNTDKYNEDVNFVFGIRIR